MVVVVVVVATEGSVVFSVAVMDGLVVVIVVVIVVAIGTVDVVVAIEAISIEGEEAEVIEDLEEAEEMLPVLWLLLLLLLLLSLIIEGVSAAEGEGHGEKFVCVEAPTEEKREMDCRVDVTTEREGRWAPLDRELRFSGLVASLKAGSKAVSKSTSKEMSSAGAAGSFFFPGRLLRLCSAASRFFLGGFLALPNSSVPSPRIDENIPSSS